MFVQVSSVSVWVSDQDRAKDFYVNKLGFELRGDQPLGSGDTRRWVSVAPKGAATELILYIAGDDWPDYRNMAGKPQPITLRVRNIQQLHEQLTAKGVQMTPPSGEFWGKDSMLTDSEGNQLVVVEMPEGSSA